MKKIIERQSKEEKSQKRIYLLLGIIGSIISLFFILVSLFMRKTQSKLKKKKKLNRRRKRTV